MAAKQVIININDANLTAENWQAFLEAYPIPDKDPPDVSTLQLKLDYIGSKGEIWLNGAIRRGRIAIANRALPNIDMNE